MINKLFVSLQRLQTGILLNYFLVYFNGIICTKKGFGPGKLEDSYLVYELAATEPVAFDDIDLKNAILKGIGNRSSDSYFTTLKNFSDYELKRM